MFFECFKYFLKSGCDDLVVYFSGHGVNVPDVGFQLKSGKWVTCDVDESDGMDEAFVFGGELLR